MNESYRSFQSIFRELVINGVEVAPRGQKVLEVEDFHYELGPYVRLQSFKARKMNIEYLKTEFIWYLRGDKYDMSICEKAKIWDQIKVRDPLGRYYLNSNYGQYVFEKNGLQHVVAELKSDKDSRRASIAIYGSEPEHTIVGVKDVPCTYSINFRIRGNYLNMSVQMRSQDAIFGMAADAPCFSFIHEMALMYLKTEYPDLQLGLYHHYANSFHVYERHFEMLNNILGEPEEDFIDIQIPRMHSGAECDMMLDMAKNGIPDYIPEEYKFTRWLFNIGE